MKKKIVSLLLTLALLLTCVPTVFAEHPFLDVSPNAWYAGDVEYAYANGLLKGVSANSFAPNSPMTRAMAVTVLWRIAGEPKVEGMLTFTDVAKDSWYEEAVLWAAQTGVVYGTTATTFSPNDLVTREQLVTILYRYAEPNGDPTSPVYLEEFGDKGRISVYAREAMSWAIYKALIYGSFEADRLMLLPKAHCTRAQTAAILRRFVLATTPVVQDKNLVGISMPTRDLVRWKQDGQSMKKQLEAAGYRVDLQFAENDYPTQYSQIERMIEKGCKVIVIAPVYGEYLIPVLEKAKQAGVEIISYDRLIRDSDAVSYYITFDLYDIGVKQGEYIENALNLKNSVDKIYHIEFVGGDPNDIDANVFFEGAMSVLGEYIDAGELMCLSGQVSFPSVATRSWSTEEAQKRMENILASYYADVALDAVCASNDSTALGIANALAVNYNNEVYPIITGMDCDIATVKNMLAGKQAMSIFKDTRDLVAKTVEMVYAILNGQEPPINDTESYDNGAIVVPTYLCVPKSCDLSNYEELLLDSGYYTREELFG